MYQLYDYFRSSASYRVRIALHYKNLPFEAIPVHLLNNGGEQHSVDYKSINPQELIPALKDGDHLITQSLAILEYLEEKHPTPALLPKDIVVRAFVRSLAQIIACDIHPLNNLRVLQYLEKEYGQEESSKKSWYAHWISKGFLSIETLLQNSKRSGLYCCGDKLSLADICLVPQVYNAQRFAVPLEQYPTIMRIHANCLQLPEVLLAHPDKQKEF